MPQATVTSAPKGAATVRSSEFTPLLREVKAAGLLRRRRGWYGCSIAVTLLSLAATGVGIHLLGNTWWTLFLAVPAAVFSTRTAFIGHDSGHAQIAGTRKANRALGLFHGNLLIGMSYHWWTDKHNRHHANPNHIDKDPDVGVGALVWTQRQAAQREGFARWLTRHQAALFFPMLLLEGIALKVSSWQDLRRQGKGERRLEALLLGLHVLGYATLLLTAMSPGKAVVFALVQHAVFGLHLGMCFAPNHKGMEMPETGDDDWGHLRRQVLTSRNVRGGAVTDWLMGGLNYQIEHHLFPNMPRPHLRRVQPLVRAHCAALGLPYAQTSAVESYRLALEHMHEVGEPLRAPDVP
ncbi:delta-6 fatty acid desaturase [Streptomyces sp. CNQ-509]|uniref:fatty acid desaturase family protein n=1 Tax=unclassified Streptomyces TaxID=2593676 RepID=UPI00062E071A|nr:acyl-CoA desaturase [Streptomyces sp. CNQ-509]AKH81212.1 delta-6 fatty acid desaturase [Streptomyces sp. CNQ-509]